MSDWTTSGSEITAPPQLRVRPGPQRDLDQRRRRRQHERGDAAGTTYDGATPLLSASTPITSGAHSLTSRSSIGATTSTTRPIFLDKLRLGTAAGGTCQTGATVLSAAKTATARRPRRAVRTAAPPRSRTPARRPHVTVSRDAGHVSQQRRSGRAAGLGDSDRPDRANRGDRWASASSSSSSSTTTTRRVSRAV
jgi:hypothetical protein